MDAGQLDRRVLIEAPTEARDAFGALVPGWSTVATVWGSVQPISGSERFLMGASISSAYFRITIRFRDDVPNKARVTINGTKTAVVHSQIELGRSEFLELICEMSK